METRKEMPANPVPRYRSVEKRKAHGATYTPKLLADFVAKQIVNAMGNTSFARPLRVLDPAVGHGELLVSLVNSLVGPTKSKIELHGFDTNETGLNYTTKRLRQEFPSVKLNLELKDFLKISGNSATGKNHQYEDLFNQDDMSTYDLIIANPPYVRTQILGSGPAQELAKHFNLSGRVDLYHAFILGISNVLAQHGVAGIIVSNRFMSTKAGSSVRRILSDRFNVRSVWDFGDTKLFDAAVLPAVLLLQGKGCSNSLNPTFTSIYETSEPATSTADDVITALSCDDGVVSVNNGRRFRVKHGTLETGRTPSDVWRIATKSSTAWLKAVYDNTWGTFRDIGKVRVGVKTCADKVFIRSDWSDLPYTEQPELLRVLTTHHVANRFRPLNPSRPKMIVYPHEVINGERRAVSLAQYPRTKAYLEKYRSELTSRSYLIDAGRDWYEIWVPQNPTTWSRPKLVFRDIAQRPTFWMDLNGTVVNGDCYWMVSRNPEDIDLLWLALAVANSTFTEAYYDLSFHNKLYSGRRRFITQYVENFPLPSPFSSSGKAIVSLAKKTYALAASSENSDSLQTELDAMVWHAFLGENHALTDRV